MHKIRYSLMAAGLAALVLGGPAVAEDAARIRELEKKLERSMEMIEALQAKVQRLEQGRGEAPSGDQEVRMGSLERQVAQLGAGLSRRPQEEGVALRGFADVGLGYTGERNAIDRGRQGFAVGSLDLFLTPQFGERVRTLVELRLEVDRDGDTEPDLERAQIGYAFSDAATAWLGRFHTPYGYWNTAIHHGAQLQTSILRPRFLDFEESTGILPAHLVGAWLTGSGPVAGNRVGYDLYGGNSPSIHLDGATGRLSPNAAGRGRNAYTGGFNAWVEPGAVDGLRLGLHGLGGAVDDDSAAANRTRLAMYGGYGVYADGRWEVMGEYFRFANRDRSGAGGTHHSWAGYGQAGYRFGQFTPYARLERARFDQGDNYFRLQRFGRSYDRVAVGLRYEVEPRAALKLEINRTDLGDLAGPNDRYNEAQLQYSIRF